MNLRLACLLTMISIPLSLLATDPEKTTGNGSGYSEDGIFYSVESKNILRNSDFSNGTSYWSLGKYNGGVATFKTDSLNRTSAEQTAIIKTEGSINNQYNDIQLFSFVEITQNTAYHISFNAEVSEECLISISIENGMETLFEEKLSLKPGKSIYGPYTYKGEMNESFAFFAFNLGRAKTIININEVIIIPDNTEKHFNEMISNGGINIESVKNGNEIYIHLPTSAREDYPIIFINENGKTVKTNIIRQGSQELFLPLKRSLDTGSYIMKVYTPGKTLAYNFNIN